MTAPPLSDTYPYAIGLREDRVEFLSYLALFYDKIGAAKIGDSAISEAAGLAVATGEGSLARVASIEWTRGHAAAAWELGAQALELASSPNDVDNALDAFSAMRPVVGEKAAVFKQSIAGINAHGN